MTDMAAARAAFLADIIEHPDDDAPRLIFADWLQDNGDPERAAFIRAQIEWARLAPDDPRRPVVQSEAQALLGAHGLAWLKEVPAWVRPNASFDRGFVMQVYVTAREFLKGAPALFRRAPIRAVRLRFASNEQVLALASADYLGRLTELDLSYNSLTDESLVPLLSSAKLGPLTALDLGSNRGGLGTVRAIAASPRLRGLTSLSLAMQPIGPEGARLLADSENLSQLEWLNLYSGDILDEGAVALFRRGRMGPLKELGLGHNSIRTEGARAIAECPALVGLTSLSLYGINSLTGPEGVRALANSPYLARLTELDPGHDIGNEGARALAESPCWRGLTSLYLNSCNLGPDGARALAGSPVLDSVQRLYLAANPVGSEGARALAESPHLGRITTLDVSQCGLGDADLARLRGRFGKGLIHR
jgi:uncharacterized protein (TIGR02996 family)